MNNHDYPANEGQKITDHDIEENNETEADLSEDDRAVADAIRAAAAESAVRGEDRDGQGAPDATAQLGELNDRLLRMAAELENTRRRSEREKRDAGQYAIASFARDLISVADNFERALQAAGVSNAEIPEGRSEAFINLVEGIKMTEKALLATLDRHGVKKVAPAGDKFDPNLHQAVANVPSSQIPKGHVVDVAQPGFTIGERVLRAAMVTVSAGPPAGDGAPGSSVDEEA